MQTAEKIIKGMQENVENFESLGNGGSWNETLIKTLIIIITIVFILLIVLWNILQSYQIQKLTEELEKVKTK